MNNPVGRQADRGEGIKKLGCVVPSIFKAYGNDAFVNLTKPTIEGMVILYGAPKYLERRKKRMFLNIVILVFCIAVIAMGIFAVLQMVRNSKKDGPKK